MIHSGNGSSNSDRRRSAPAAQRNKQPIADVLQDELPESGTVLEIASGTGEHAVFFAELFPQLCWQPSDIDPGALVSIDAWREQLGLVNLSKPIRIDVSQQPWPVQNMTAVLCVNMVHISPWAATEGLFRGAARLLPRGGPLILYGPYLEDEIETAPSNLQFDHSLKARNPEWGLRKVTDLDRLAAQWGFSRARRVAMPANNIILIYR